MVPRAGNWRSFFKTLAQRWTSLTERRDVQVGLKYLRYAFFCAILFYLFVRLSRVGWIEVATSLPSSPWFYIFFMLRFLALPISELALYEIIWGKSLVRHFLVFIRKRVYNFAVMGYSGEAFLTLWARRKLALSDKTIVVGVKDNNLLSAFASNAATVIIIIFLAITGGLQAGLNAFPGARWLFTLAFISAGVLSFAVMIFRKKLMALPQGVMPRLLTVHASRQVLIIILHTAMYAAALPGTPLLTWLIFIALQLVLSRIPFLPNQDVVYLGAALALAPMTGAPEAVIAGMLVAEAGLSQLFNVILFVATAHLARSSKKAA